MGNQMPYGNATVFISPPPPGGMMAQRPMQFAPPQFAPQQFAPIMQPRAMGGGIQSYDTLINLGQAALSTIFARPADVTPPPVSADANTQARNLTTYTAAVSKSMLDAKRNEVLIDAGSQAARAVLAFASQRRMMGQPILSL